MELRHFAFSSSLAKASRFIEPNFTHFLRPLAWVIGLLTTLACLHGIQDVLTHRLEREAFEVKPNGTATPAQFGAPFKDIQIVVDDHILHARFVVSTANAPALLLFHGNGEALSDWANVQARLWKQGVSSMVFDYSGFGDSSGTPSVDAMHEDARSAYKAFVQAMPVSAPKIRHGAFAGQRHHARCIPRFVACPRWCDLACRVFFCQRLRCPNRFGFEFCGQSLAKSLG